MLLFQTTLRLKGDFLQPNFLLVLGLRPLLSSLSLDSFPWQGRHGGDAHPGSGKCLSECSLGPPDPGPTHPLVLTLFTSYVVLGVYFQVNNKARAWASQYSACAGGTDH